MDWLAKIWRALGFGRARAPRAFAQNGIMSRAEKRELELAIRVILFDYYDRAGTGALLEPGVFITLGTEGPVLSHDEAEARAALAYLETRDLPSARALLAVAQGPIVVSRDAVKHLGTEATSLLAQQINNLADQAQIGDG
jgi:hypothetical protein